MNYDFTLQRKNYLEARGKIVLNACPGSGKTTSIAKKLGLLQEGWCNQYCSYAGIACLSFTNSAKDEILKKHYEVNGHYIRYPHIISTIDSFINRYITLPYFNLFGSIFKRPKIVDDDLILKSAFSCIYKDKKGDIREGRIFPLNTFKDNKGSALYRRYDVHEIYVEKNGQFTFKGKQPDLYNVSLVEFQNYGKAIFKKKLDKGLITNQDSSYIALQLLSNYKRIGEYLISRFPYIMIDEAQDNSELQHAIFDKLVQYGLKNIELIGDPYQSLYEWRNAKPKLFIQKYENKDWQGLPLCENRRSNQRIIDFYSKLRLPDDEKINSKNVEDHGLPIIIYKYNEINKELIIDDFESKCHNNKLENNQIVVRGNTLKNRMLGNIIPIEPWKSIFPYSLIKALNYKESQEIKKAISELRKLSVELKLPNGNYIDKKELESLYQQDSNHNAILYCLLKTIPSLDLSFRQWTHQSEELLKEHLDLETKVNFDFKLRMDGFKMNDLLNESISSYYKKNISSKFKIPITTIHQVKGATLDAILIFLNEDSHGESISFKDFILPDSFPKEKQRIIYVACSRPKHLLAIAISDKITNEVIKNKFGANIFIHE